MAKASGYVFSSAKKPQGAGRVRPADWARNNLSMGGTNKMEAKSGKTSMGKTVKGKGTSGTSKA